MHRIGTNLYAAGIDYFRNVRTYKIVRFIFELTFLSLVTKLLFVMVIGWGYETLTDSSFTELETPVSRSENRLKLFVLACLFAPLAETFFINFIPIYFLNKLIKNSYILILIASIIFSLMHISHEYLYPIIIFPLSFVLSFGFVVKMKESFIKAFVITASIHALHNFISLVIFVLAE